MQKGKSPDRWPTPSRQYRTVTFSLSAERTRVCYKTLESYPALLYTGTEVAVGVLIQSQMSLNPDS